jgi:hypothetical protein
MQNIAFVSQIRIDALFSQACQLLFQVCQLADPLPYMFNVFFEKDIYSLAVFIGRIQEMEQFPDFDMGHVQVAAVTYKRQTFQMLLTVIAIVPGSPLRLG